MKRVGTILLCLTGGLVLNTAARADDVATADNPYAVIAERNIFGLLPPPTNDPSAKPPDPPTKITLTGIMNLLGTSQALYKTAGGPTKPNEPKEKSYMLSEGEQEDDIEVVKIDDKAKMVTFNNHGVMQDVPLANTPSGGASGGGPAPAKPPPGFPNFPTFRPNAAPGGAAGGAFNTFGGGANPFAGRNPGGNPGNNFNSGASGGAPVFGSGYGGNSGNANPQAVAVLPPDQQMLMITAQHLKAQQEGSPMAPLFPPTPLDREAGITQDSGNGGSPPAP